MGWPLTPKTGRLGPRPDLFSGLRIRAGLKEHHLLDGVVVGVVLLVYPRFDFRGLGLGLVGQRIGITAGHALANLVAGVVGEDGDFIDRKSTRLNSSHVRIAYAVLCLKKKRGFDGCYIVRP